MSALPPKADMCSATRDVRFGPKADIPSYSITSSARYTISGHALAEPPRMPRKKSRRLTHAPQRSSQAIVAAYASTLEGARQPSNVRFGQKQTFALQMGMSASPPKADKCGAARDVRFGPKADMIHTSNANKKTASPRLETTPFRGCVKLNKLIFESSAAAYSFVRQIAGGMS